MHMNSYEKYISHHFGNLHPAQTIHREYRRYLRYYNANIIPLLPKDKSCSILEIGPGMGHFLYCLKQNGYTNVSAVDVSPECVTFCHKMGFTFVKEAHGLKYLQQVEQCFDVICMFDVIEHFPKGHIFILLEYCRKKLTQNGLLLIKTLNAGQPFLGMSNYYSDITHQTAFTCSSLMEVLRLCEFSRVKCIGINLYVFYLNPFNYLAALCAVLISVFFKLYFTLHSRGMKYREIFTKDIMAIGQP